VKDAVEIDVDHFAPVLWGDLPRLGAGADARIGDDDVDTAELLQTTVEHGLHLVEVTGIGDLGNDVTTGLLDQAHRLLKVFLGGSVIRSRRWLGTQIQADDVGALLGERQCV